MLRTSIVPECHRIRSPLKSTLEFGDFDMPEERLEDRIALALLQLNDPGSKHSIDEESLPAGLRMSPQYRMLGARKFATAFSGWLASFIVARTVMDRGQAAQKSLHRFRKR